MEQELSIKNRRSMKCTMLRFVPALHQSQLEQPFHIIASVKSNLSLLLSVFALLLTLFCYLNKSCTLPKVVVKSLLNGFMSWERV